MSQLVAKLTNTATSIELEYQYLTPLTENVPNPTILEAETSSATQPVVKSH